MIRFPNKAPLNSQTLKSQNSKEHSIKWCSPRTLVKFALHLTGQAARGIPPNPTPT